MKRLISNFLSPSTMTVLGGFAIIFATALALGSMTQDETGNSIATAAMAFRSELEGDSQNFEVIPISPIDQNENMEPPPKMEDRFTIPLKMIDDSRSRTDEFRNLLSELQRVAGSASASLPFREVTIDFTSADFGSESSAFAQACELLDAVAPSSNSMHFEIRQWAASPTTAAWVNAVHAASVLRHDLQKHVSKNSSPRGTISSSAALWPHADRIRPELTIIVRQTVADHNTLNVPGRFLRN